jgi:hypothetical protein
MELQQQGRSSLGPALGRLPHAVLLTWFAQERSPKGGHGRRTSSPVRIDSYTDHVLTPREAVACLLLMGGGSLRDRPGRKWVAQQRESRPSGFRDLRYCTMATSPRDRGKCRGWFASHLCSHSATPSGRNTAPNPIALIMEKGPAKKLLTNRALYANTDGFDSIPWLL